MAAWALRDSPRARTAFPGLRTAFLTMFRVRKEDADGDMLFGHGDADFHIDSAAGVGQVVKTRLLLWQGDWFLDLQEGTPYLQRILGKSTPAARNAAIRDRIAAAPFVQRIDDFSTQVNTVTRAFTVSAKLVTAFSGVVTLTVTPGRAPLFTLDVSPLDDPRWGL